MNFTLGGAQADRDIYRGERSLPSCLAGGDLDGDDYNLILDASLHIHVFCLSILTSTCTQPALHPSYTMTPGEYKGLPNKTTQQPCTIDDIADFFINYVGGYANFISTPIDL